MLRKILLLSLTLAAGLTACKSTPAQKSDDKPVTQEVTPEEPVDTNPYKDIVMEIDGEPVVVRGVAAHSQGSSARTLEISSKPLPCSRFEPWGWANDDDEIYVTVNFQSFLQRDGTFTQEVKHVIHGVRHSAKPGGGLKLGEPDEKGVVSFALGEEVLFEANEFRKRPEMKIKLQGEGNAPMCGAWKSKHEARLQNKLQVTVSGASFVIQGARLKQSMGTTQLHLSSGAASCEDGADKSDLSLQFGITPAKDDTKLPVYMGGDVFATQNNAKRSTEEIKVTAAGPLEAGQEPVTLTVDAAFEMDGYQVKVQGEVEALNCL